MISLHQMLTSPILLNSDYLVSKSTTQRISELGFECRSDSQLFGAMGIGIKAFT